MNTYNLHQRSAEPKLPNLWIGFLPVAGGVWLHGSEINRQIMIAIHARPHMDPWVWDWMTQWGDAGLMLALLLLWTRSQPAQVALLLKTWLLGAVLSQTLKRCLEVPRPGAILDLSLWGLSVSPPTFGHSMPSGHAWVAASALALVLRAGHRMHTAWIISLSGLSLMVAWSRVAVGAHWPADVLVGWGLGWAVVWLANQWEQRQPWELWMDARPGSELIAGLSVSLMGYCLCWPAESEGARIAFWLGTAISLYCSFLQIRMIRRRRSC